MTAALLGAVLAGSLAQRATGMGLALVAAPFIVVALGPASGVLMVNLLGLVTSLLVLARVWADVEWGTYWRLMPSSLLGVAAGALLAARLPATWAQIVVGVVVLLALGVSSVVARTRSMPRTTGAVATAGGVSGLTSALAGIGGPPMAVLRTLTRWDHIGFAATLQPYFATTGAVTVAAKVLADPGAWPDLAWSGWAAIAVAMIIGVGLGGTVTRRLPAAVLGRLITALAALGSVWTVVDGVAAL
ncbi:TSUP family transporter [Georgenia sp. AZ-5]|uniref:TSUP family transporter n=1 Tax=Georgenia sp. AZ-5 TaxID=3367526 RepID=UPI003753EB63